jgi:prevent-host-death family protein
MASPIIPTETYKFTEARPQLSELLNRVFRLEARLLISKGNIPVAAIVSVNDLERLNRLDAERAADFEIFEQISSKFLDQTPEEIERAVAEALAEVRAEKAAELDKAIGQ